MAVLADVPVATHTRRRRGETTSGSYPGAPLRGVQRPEGPRARWKCGDTPRRLATNGSPRRPDGKARRTYWTGAARQVAIAARCVETLKPSRPLNSVGIPWQLVTDLASCVNPSGGTQRMRSGWEVLPSVGITV